MLSYRHAFHAGNHADVLKHFVLSELARYLGQKDAPFYYMDTHAGAGLYSLDIGYATKLAEYVDGIGRLWDRDDLPESLGSYVKLVREINPDGKLKAYPGSPWIAHQVLRDQDRLRLFELHPADAELLHANFRQFPRRVATDHAQSGDGRLPGHGQQRQAQRAHRRRAERKLRATHAATERAGRFQRRRPLDSHDLGGSVRRNAGAMVRLAGESGGGGVSEHWEFCQPQSELCALKR